MENFSDDIENKILLKTLVGETIVFIVRNCIHDFGNYSTQVRLSNQFLEEVWKDIDILSGLSINEKTVISNIPVREANDLLIETFESLDKATDKIDNKVTSIADFIKKTPDLDKNINFSKLLEDILQFFKLYSSNISEKIKIENIEENFTFCGNFNLFKFSIINMIFILFKEFKIITTNLLLTISGNSLFLKFNYRYIFNHEEDNIIDINRFEIINYIFSRLSIDVKFNNITGKEFIVELKQS